ncbi:unnamed protein product [Closterium sp. NIES-53]
MHYLDFGLALSFPVTSPRPALLVVASPSTNRQRRALLVPVARARPEPRIYVLLRTPLSGITTFRSPSPALCNPSRRELNHSPSLFPLPLSPALYHSASSAASTSCSAFSAFPPCSSAFSAASSAPFAASPTAAASSPPDGAVDASTAGAHPSITSSHNLTPHQLDFRALAQASTGGTHASIASSHGVTSHQFDFRALAQLDFRALAQVNSGASALALEGTEQFSYGRGKDTGYLKVFQLTRGTSTCCQLMCPSPPRTTSRLPRHLAPPAQTSAPSLRGAPVHRLLTPPRTTSHHLLDFRALAQVNMGASRLARVVPQVVAQVFQLSPSRSVPLHSHYPSPPPPLYLLSFLSCVSHPLPFREQDFAANELMPRAAEWDARKHFPVDVLRKAAGLGFASLFVKEDVGGSGLGRADGAVVFEALAHADVSTTAYLTIHNMNASIIDRWGTGVMTWQGWA